ncbi:tyrosine-protein phosphatase [Sanguibacteroides sp. AM78-02pH3A]|uniref:tyrosine-protein phosphatase n=1 Tax=Sanguibacteroides sp. AM78-02pH3A TaxID=3002646 RepID=UPI0022DFA5FC|nr:CpsB/CapC family capsule biosynthesis tyrosine phosphatase [Sanguibacteroides sp. AM78-02pH3A]
MFFRKRSVKQYFFYGHDLHSHILPGLDDGVKTVEESAEIVKRMLKLGVKRFTFTPHIVYPLLMNGPENIGKRWEELEERLKREDIRLDADIGAEYRVGRYMFDLIGQKQIMASGGERVLLEHSFLAPSLYFEELLFQLQTEGFEPVLAHPERYRFYGEDIEKACRELKGKGCRLQVNLLSFTGYYGKEARKGAYVLLKRGLIDYLSGDIHSLRQIELLEDFLKSKESDVLNRYSPYRLSPI